MRAGGSYLFACTLVWVTEHSCRGHRAGDWGASSCSCSPQTLPNLPPPPPGPGSPSSGRRRVSGTPPAVCFSSRLPPSCPGPSGPTPPVLAATLRGVRFRCKVWLPWQPVEIRKKSWCHMCWLVGEVAETLSREEEYMM